MNPKTEISIFSNCLKPLNDLMQSNSLEPSNGLNQLNGLKPSNSLSHQMA